MLSLYSTATQNYWPTLIFAFGGSPNAKICVGNTNMLVSKNTKICRTPNTKHKICVSPNANQWNIGCIGSPTQNIYIGQVHFIFVDVDFFQVGSHFSVEYGLYLKQCVRMSVMCMIFGTCASDECMEQFCYFGDFYQML